MPSILQGLGTEEIVDEAFLIMRDVFNEVVALQQERWDALDQRRAVRMGITIPQIIVEPVPLDNFHVGSIPSFVQTEDRETHYPMVVVTPGRTIPSAEDAAMDHYNVYQNAIAFHSFARGNVVEGPEIAYRRAMRMAEAVHHVVHSNRELRRMVAGLSGPVLVDRSEPWFFPSEDGHGEDWCWMAVMHQYQIKNYSYTPEEVL